MQGGVQERAGAAFQWSLLAESCGQHLFSLCGSTHRTYAQVSSAQPLCQGTVHASQSRGRLVWLMSVPLSPSRPETVIQHNPRPHRNHTVSGDCLYGPAQVTRDSQSLEGDLPGAVRGQCSLERARLKSCRLPFFLRTEFCQVSCSYPFPGSGSTAFFCPVSSSWYSSSVSLYLL